jgi:TP901 family phage tail tape measure protein
MSTYAVDMSLRLIDGVSPVYAAMSKASTRFSDAQSRAFRRGNAELRSMISTAKGFVVGHAFLGGINRIRSGITSLTTEWINFDNASRFAASKFEEVTSGVLTFEEALAKTKQTSIEISAVTMFTASQVATAMDNMALSGYTLEQSQAAVYDITKFATLAQMDLLEATQASTGALGAFNLKTDDSVQLAENFGSLMDKMTATFTSSRMDLEQLTQAITAGGASFVNSSQDIATFNTMLFAMAEGGIVGEKAGMRMRAIIDRLSDATPKAQKALSTLGVTTRDSVTGDFLPMLDVLDQMRVSLSKYGTADRAAFIKRIFGLRNITGINLILNKSKQELEDYYTSIANSAGAADAQMKRVQGSMAQRLLILKSVITAKFFTGMETGESPIANMVSGMIEAVQNIDMAKVNAFIATNLPVFIDEMRQSFVRLWPDLKSAAIYAAKFFELVATNIDKIALITKWFIRYRVAMMALAVAQGILSLATSVWIKELGITLYLTLLEIQKNGLLAGVKLALASATWLQTAAQWAANAATYAFPAVWIVAAIAAVIAVVYTLTVGWKKWGETITNVWHKIRPVLYLIMPPLAIIIDLIITLRNNWDNMVKAFEDGGFLSMLKSIGGTIMSSLLAPIELLLIGMNKLGLVSDNAVEGFKAMRNGMLEYGQSVDTVGAGFTDGVIPRANDLSASPSARPWEDASYSTGISDAPISPSENPYLIAPNTQEVAFQQQSLDMTMNLAGNTDAVDSVNVNESVGVNFSMGPN